MIKRQLDGLIVGGGPASLTAAIYLARFHLPVSAWDEGSSHFLPAPLMAATDSEGCMKSIEIFLPLNASDGTPFPDTTLNRIEKELAEKFGGVTAYKRAPAQGRWKRGGQTQRDEIAIFEVVVDRLERSWWRRFREELEDRLGQETILVTARDIEIL